MWMHLSAVRWWVVCAVGWLSACGGGSVSVAPPPPVSSPPPPAVASTVLQARLRLALAAPNPRAWPPITGTPRVFEVFNIGPATAYDVALDATALPAGTTAVSTCGTLAPQATCTVTVTPGTVATTETVVLPMKGSNTNTVMPRVAVLAYGSVFEGGYVFSIDDTRPNTESVYARMAAQSDAAPGVIWSSNGSSGAPASTAYDNIPGISETSVNPPDRCDGAASGGCNTGEILARYPGVDPSYFAAGACSQTIGGNAGWSLPSICELGGSTALGCTAGKSMQENLIDNGALSPAQLPSAIYWSSTQEHANPHVNAWAHRLHAALPQSGGVSKSNAYRVRCVREILP